MDVRHGKTKKVENFEEVVIQPLGTKLVFLCKHKLQNISKVGKPAIRNSAAHLTYQVKNGDVYLPENSTPINMNLEHNGLREVSIGGYLALLHYYETKYGPFKN